MAFYLLEYTLVDDYFDRRPPLRSEHLALANAAFARGELILAGALADPARRAVFVWSADDTSAIEEFVAADPYVREGLVVSSSISPWTVVIGAGAPQIA